MLNPDAPEVNRRAPEQFRVRLDTSRGAIVIEVHRDWAPHGTDRFYNLVRAGYYDDARFFRVVAGRWAQFGVNGDPKISAAWRNRTIPDDPRRESNVRGTIAFAFAVPNGRTTEVFLNLQDNSATHDAEPFVPFGRVIEGMDVADSLNAEYGESAGGGIRGGRQGPLFEEGNAWLGRNFPRLDFIRRATIQKAGGYSSLRQNLASAADFGSVDVAQICNMAYRGFEIRRGRQVRSVFPAATPCRMPFGDTADYKSALQALRFGSRTMELFSLATGRVFAPTFCQLRTIRSAPIQLRST